MEKQNAAPKAPGEQQLDGIGNNAKTEDFRMKNKVYEINKTCIRPVRLGAEFVGFRVWSTHVKLRKKTAKKMIKRLEYVFAAYHAGEMDREKMNRTVASYKGILKHFNSHGMAQKLNDIYRREVMGNAAN